MSFPYSNEGIELNPGFEPIPLGKYQVKIDKTEERVTKNGDPMVVVDYLIVNGPYKGKVLRFHNVVFLSEDANGKPKKGAGMAIHYLKTIGEPYEGKFIVDPPAWIGKQLMATVGQEKGVNGIVRNNVRFVDPVINPVKSDEEVPF